MSYRILFVPVSSPEGVGEYMRSLIIAQTLVSQDPSLDIQFVLNEQAPYIQQCPFRVHPCPSSPTKHSDIVNNIIREFKPNIVIFDASGRASQLRAAKENSAHTIFLAQHDKKLAKGLSWRRLKHTDTIFVVQPIEIMQPLTAIQKIKTQWLRPTPVHYCGPVFVEPSEVKTEEVLKALALKAEEFILFSAGGGGHIVQGRSASEIFVEAASTIHTQIQTESQTQSQTQSHTPCVVVKGKNFSGDIASTAANENVILCDALAPEEFSCLLRAAKLAVLGGGDSLLQSLALNTPVVAVALAKDQSKRIQQCNKKFNCQMSEPDAESIASAVQAFLNDSTKTIISQNKVSNGLSSIVTHIQETLNNKRVSP